MNTSMNMSMSIKTHNYECCMCGDHGLPHELFRCKVCHFRSQHRYCSNLYPKAETYRVCNWCLIQKDDRDAVTTTTTTTTTTTASNNNSSNSSSPENLQSKSIKKFNYNNNNNQMGGGPNNKSSPKCLQPTSCPIKKPAKSPESRSPSTRKRITAGNTNPAQAQAQAQSQQEERLIIRRTKSSGEISNRISPRSSSGGGPGPGPGPCPGGAAPAVIKHVFRNKVRRYKLLDEVSS